MRNLLPLLAIVAAALSLGTSAHAQAIMLKDNTRIDAEQLTIVDGKIMRTIKVGTNSAQAQIPTTGIASIDWIPAELAASKELLAAGKSEEAVELLKKAKAFFDPFKDIPGNSYPEILFAYAEVLNQSGKFEDIIKLMPDIKKLNLDEAQKLQIKLIELNTERQTSSDADGIIAQAQNILSETQDSAVGASIWMIIGDTLFGKKRWEEALMAYLRVTVFYGTQVQRVPDAELASARCLAKMRRFDDAAVYYKRLVETYPGSTVAATATSEMANINGLHNEDETPPKAGDKAAATDAKPADAKPAEASK
jgi:tetratricopeptide (TPR) repeat protein